MLKKFCKNAFNEFIRKLEIAEKRMKEYGDRSIETSYIEMQREKEIKLKKKKTEHKNCEIISQSIHTYM